MKYSNDSITLSHYLFLENSSRIIRLSQSTTVNVPKWGLDSTRILYPAINGDTNSKM